MTDSYELLGAGSCDATLPVNAVVEEHTFGQFITLNVTLNGMLRPVSMLDTKTAAKSPFTMRRLVESGGVPLDILVGGGEMVLPRFQTVTLPPDGVDRLLARGELEVDGQVARVTVNAGVARAVLAGEPLSLTAMTADGPRAVRILPSLTKAASAPAVLRHEIDDLAAFMSNPVVPGDREQPLRIDLTPQVVRQLRSAGSARLRAAGKTVDVVVSAPTAATHAGDVPRPATTKLAMAPAGSMVKGDTAATPMVLPDSDGQPLPGPETALFLPWKQRWVLLGYSRGALLHSLSLAPQEETTIELFTWDRSKRTLEQESDTETEQSFERVDVAKDTTDVINELTKSNEFQVQADARVKVTYPVVQTDVGAAFQNKDNVTQVAKRTAQHLTESTTKAATRVKTRRTTKITESSEVAREERVIRKVRNSNMCHTLNLDYFEVVANYWVVTEFAEEDAAICVLVDMPPDITSITFTRSDCRVHEKALRGALLDPGLAAGFDAAKLLESRNHAKQLVCDKIRCAPALGSPPSDHGRAPAEMPGGVTKAFNDAIDAVRRLSRMSYKPLMRAWDLGSGGRYEDWAHYPEQTRTEQIQQFQGWLYWALFKRLLPRLATALTADPPNMEAVLSAVPDRAELAQPGNLNDALFEQHRNELRDFVINRYSRTEIDIGGRMVDPLEALWYRNTLASHGALIAYDNGLASALSRFSNLYNSWQSGLQQSQAPTDPVRETQQQQVDTDSDRLEYAYPLRDIADAEERFQALAQHLAWYHSHYHYALLQAMPLGDQMQLLAGANAPLELCEPRIIGMIQGTFGAADRVAVPLNLALLAPGGGNARDSRGNTGDSGDSGSGGSSSGDSDVGGDSRSGDDSPFAKLRQSVEDILDGLRASEGGTRTISLPTPGVMVESRLGRCGACEDYITESRDIELDQRREQVNAARTANALQEAELARYRARLNANPPLLDDPNSTVDGIRVRMDPITVTVEEPVKQSDRPNRGTGQR